MWSTKFWSFCCLLRQVSTYVTFPGVPYLKQYDGLLIEIMSTGSKSRCYIWTFSEQGRAGNSLEMAEGKSSTVDSWALDVRSFIVKSGLECKTILFASPRPRGHAQKQKKVGFTNLCLHISGYNYNLQLHANSKQEYLILINGDNLQLK